MANIPTPHIGAQLGQVADTVLMPGDPFRAKFIADTYLKNVEQYNDIRGMFGYTGLYKGKRVSVQGSGMGMPSIGIYSYELFNFYGVKNIIRVGTAGSINENLHVRDLVIAQGACTDSAYARQYGLPGDYSAISCYDLLEKAVNAARNIGVKFAVGNVLSSDAFYGADESALSRWAKMGVLAVEMESAALFMNAAKAGKNALALLTVSDEVFSGVTTTAEERQSSFTAMMEIALEIA